MSQPTMGLKKPSTLNYLTVSFGRIRKNVSEGTPDAVSRENKEKVIVWELIWQSLTGKITDVSFKQHEKYGNSWILEIDTGAEQFALQLQEDSRFGGDFLKKLPNLRVGEIYTFTPYDYEKNRKRKVGIAIEDADGNKIQSYYQKFTENADKTWTVENLFGFPEFIGDPKDKDDQKIYFTQVTKFLRGKSLEIIKSFKIVKPQQEQTNFISDKDSDLPF